MASYINIEDRYRASSIRERQMQYVWAATAAAVVSVGATAAGAAMSYSASQKAGKAQAAASKKAARKEKKALKGQQAAAAQYEAEMGQVQAPAYDLGAMLGDAAQVSAFRRAQAEAFLPGGEASRAKALQQINEALDVLSVGARGEYSQELKKNVMKDVAQFAGAGFNPAMAGKVGGFQASQGFGAAQLGKTAEDIQRWSISAMPSVQNMLRGWTETAQSFIAQPEAFGQLRLGYGQAATDLAMQQATARYNARAGLAGEQKRMAGTEYERAIEGAKIDLATGQQLASGITSTGQAVAQAGKTYSEIQSKKEYIEALKGLDSYGQYDARLNDPNTPYLFGSQIIKTSYPYNAGWSWNSPDTGLRSYT